MEFRNFAFQVLKTMGSPIKKKQVYGMSIDEICALTSLPAPHKKQNHTITFTGYDKNEDKNLEYLRVDAVGLKRTLKYMTNKKEIVITKPQIKVVFEFEFDKGPFTRKFIANKKKGFTREYIAKKIAKEYQRLFSNRKKNGVWVESLKHVGIHVMYYDPKSNRYVLDNDINED